MDSAFIRDFADDITDSKIITEFIMNDPKRQDSMQNQSARRAPSTRQNPTKKAPSTAARNAANKTIASCHTTVNDAAEKGDCEAAMEARDTFHKAFKKMFDGEVS